MKEESINKQLSLKEIQQEETKILIKVINYLNNNDITYYIWGGSFLGTVRHKGFIPWDDDIDIAITRKEYNKLLELLRGNNKIDENIEAIGFELNNFDTPFIKIINKKINIREEMNYDKYLWIDIFPIDGVPKKHKMFYIILKMYEKMYLWKRSKERNWNEPKINIFKKLLKNFVLLLMPVKYDTIIRRYIKIHRSKWIERL